MFIDNVKDKNSIDIFNNGNIQKTQQWEKEIFLRLISNRNGWRVLTVWPGSGEELTIMAHQLGAKGEMVVIDTDTAILEQIERNKLKGLYQTRSTQNLSFGGAYSRYAKIQAAVHTQQFDGVTIDFVDNYFDAIWCPLNNKPHSDPIHATLMDEFYRIVRPGGFIAICQDNVFVAD